MGNEFIFNFVDKYKQINNTNMDNTAIISTCKFGSLIIKEADEMINVKIGEAMKERYTLEEIGQAWKNAYSEDIHEEYPGFVKLLQQLNK